MRIRCSSCRRCARCLAWASATRPVGRAYIPVKRSHGMTVARRRADGADLVAVRRAPKGTQARDIDSTAVLLSEPERRPPQVRLPTSGSWPLPWVNDDLLAAMAGRLLRFSWPLGAHRVRCFDCRRVALGGSRERASVGPLWRVRAAMASSPCSSGGVTRLRLSANGRRSQCRKGLAAPGETRATLAA